MRFSYCFHGYYILNQNKLFCFWNNQLLLLSATVRWSIQLINNNNSNNKYNTRFGWFCFGTPVIVPVIVSFSCGSQRSRTNSPVLFAPINCNYPKGFRTAASVWRSRNLYTPPLIPPRARAHSHNRYNDQALLTIT